MSDRFEFVTKQRIDCGESINSPGLPDRLNTFVLRDKQTGVLYLWCCNNNAGGMTTLLDKNGKPVVDISSIITNLKRREDSK